MNAFDPKYNKEQRQLVHASKFFRYTDVYLRDLHHSLRNSADDFFCVILRLVQLRDLIRTPIAAHPRFFEKWFDRDRVPMTMSSELEYVFSTRTTSQNVAIQTKHGPSEGVLQFQARASVQR